MKNLRKSFNRFCFKHRDKGIPNLMLFVSIGCAVVSLFTLITQNNLLFDLLEFDRARILQGEVWRLFSYPLTYATFNPLFTVLLLVTFTSIGRAMENSWGVLRFNLFYLTGIMLMDAFCMIFGGSADVFYLNLSLFLAYATMYPDEHFLVMMIIPIKARWLAMLDLFWMLYDVITYTVAGLFPISLFPFVALLNYFLFFGKDILNVIPLSWQANFRRLFRKKRKKSADEPKVIPFPQAGSFEATVAKPKGPYNHICAVCGRTDESHPDLEFRYCSRCNGYYCYCIDHINNHEHVQ